MRPSIADLEAAAAAGALEAWLQHVPDRIVRTRVRRAIEIDRPLWKQYPASLASCLLARTLGDVGLAELHARWTRELNDRAGPWIAALRPLPVPDGLLAESHDIDPSLTWCSQLVFESEEIVRLVLDTRKRPPEKDHREHLRWSWLHGEMRIEPAPQPDGAAGRDREHFPRIEHDGWGPSFLIRSQQSARITLPCPEGGSAWARFTADGTQLIVYGTLDEYDGGFVYLVDPTTLAIERSLDTRRPVSEVYECAHRDLLLVSTYGGLVAWRGERGYELPLQVRSSVAVALSPSGAHVASFQDGLWIWSLDALIRRSSAHPKSGFPTCFDPSGDRLVCGRQLFDGRTGRLLAELEPSFGQYLMGGPASPWQYVGTRYVISVHGQRQIWDTHSGRRLQDQKDAPRYRSGNLLAYDREGNRFAVLGHGTPRVDLCELTSSRRLRELRFEIEGTAIKISPDGRAIAIQGGGAVEIRDTGGGMLLCRDHPVAGAGKRSYHNHDDTLRFSIDGQRIARFVEGDGWRIWSLVGDRTDHMTALEALDEVPDFTPPRPRDWTVQAGTKTVFTHRPTGTQIALPVAGPWVCNPANPRILACDAAHLELRAR